MNGSSRHGSHPETNRRQARPNGRSAAPRPAPSGPVPDSDRLARLLEPVIAAMNMDLESLKVSAAGRRRLLRVVVDADGGVSLDDIALASRELSAKLDNATEMGEQPYTLEVSSPGVDRPLTQPRHWRRAIGRLVVVPLTAAAPAAQDGNEPESADGRITGCSDRGVTLDQDGVSREYAYAELGAGKIQVEFGHFDAGDDDLDDEPGEED
jgi:ribosome maturation factor RimP